MGLSYDENIFAVFKALSIKEESEIEIGRTYYTNSYPASFTVIGFETRAENDIRHGFPKREYENDKNEWMVTGPNEWNTKSMSDLNIGASYNPWLMFANEEDAIRCREEFIVTMTEDPLDYMDDWAGEIYERDSEEELSER